MSDKTTILIAEDDANDRLLLRLAFDKAGRSHCIFEVKDGQQAVDYLSGNPPFSNRVQHPFPHLMVMDLNMPRMDGLEVLAWLRTRPDLEQLPVVVLSDSTLASDIAKARKLGAKDYRIKPWDFGGLVNLVQELHACWLVTAASDSGHAE